MIKVKIEEVKRDDEKQNFFNYPFSIQRDSILIYGVIKLDLENKKIKVNILKVKINTWYCSLPYMMDFTSKYCLEKEEKLALMKEIFYIFVCKYKVPLFNFSNRDIAMFEFDEVNCKREKTTLLNEFLKYKQTDFNEHNKKERLLTYIIYSIKTLKKYNTENIREDEIFELLFIKHMNSNDKLYYLEIFNDYLKQEYDDIRVDIEKCRRIGKLLVYCYRLKKYTITPIFPNKEIMDNAMQYIH